MEDGKDLARRNPADAGIAGHSGLICTFALMSSSLPDRIYRSSSSRTGRRRYAPPSFDPKNNLPECVWRQVGEPFILNNPYQTPRLFPRGSFLPRPTLCWPVNKTLRNNSSSELKTMAWSYVTMTSLGYLRISKTGVESLLDSSC